MSIKTDSASSSVYSDVEMGVSEAEVLSSEWDQDAEMQRDYWFGKKYLECIAAQDLLHHTSLHETMAGIDSKLETVMRRYPFHQRLETLQARGISTSEFGTLNGEQDAYRALLSLTGAVVRKGNREQKALLISTLRNAASMGSSVSPRGISGSSSVAANDNRDEGQQWWSSTSKRVANVEIAPYTMALKEFGDKSSAVPVYNTQRLSLDPPSFRATVTFQGFTFEGKAKTKKQAGHYAAKEACDYLGIKIS